MTYVAFLRVRHRLIVFLAIVLVLVALNTLTVFFGHGYHHGSSYSIGYGSEAPTGSGRDFIRRLAGDTPFPLAFGFAIAIAFTLFFATFATGSLNGMRESLHVVFTRPLAREAVALRFFAVDAASLACCFVAICLVIACELAVLGLGSHVYVDAAALPTLVFGFGIAFMYYGTVQAITAWQRGGAGALVGGLWAVFFVAALLKTSPFGPVFDGIVAAIRFVDPLVYFATLASAIGSAAPLAVDLQPMGIVWAIGLAGCAIALLSWKRLEV